MSNLIHRGNEQFEPKLYNNEINAAGSKSACQSLGPQSGGSTPTGRETYGVRNVDETDAKMFSGSYAPISVSKLNQCGAGKKKKKKSTKKKSSKKKSSKKKSSKKKSTKKKSSKKKSTKKKSTKKKSTKKKGLVTKFRKAFGMKGGALESYTAGYTSNFDGIAPNNSSLANHQPISRVNSCQAPHSYNHYTGVSK